MRISGFDDPDSSGWDALHRGTEREGFDSPSKFDMSTLSMIMPKRKPARPQPDAQGYTDEDTREWGSSADDEDDYAASEPADEPTGRRARRSPSREHPGDDHARPEPGALPGRRSPEFGEDRVRPESGGLPGRRSPEFGEDRVRPESGAFPGRRSPEFGGDYGRPDPGALPGRRPAAGDHDDRLDPGGFAGRRPPGFSGDEHARPAFGGYQNRHSPEFGDEQPVPDPLGFQGAHSPVVAEDGYDPVEPEWQDGERFEPEPPPLEPAWTPPRGARPPAPPA
ncbi:DUF742 domain-containing protein, partial [Amycolatopsis sp. H6(2020)]|nr:DUF742 domain-containing protein [Amycolatopsis sp. H6(2020)]